MNQTRTKRALVLGVAGQCGSYLADVLLERGYEVHGMVRRLPSPEQAPGNIAHLLADPAVFGKTFHLCVGDLADTLSLTRVLHDTDPDEIYNEAGVDHVSGGMEISATAADITGPAVGRLLEIIRQTKPAIRFFLPCTSHMFGKPATDRQNEATPFDPLSLYACHKLYAYSLCRYYRRRHDLFAATGILYNHESPRRSPRYLSRKVSRAVALIAAGKLDRLPLGNLDVAIDWSYARECMDAAVQILQLDRPDDFVLASGQVHTVRAFVDAAFRRVNLDASKYVVTDPALYRPVTNDCLRGDVRKAREAFGYAPKVTMHDLVAMMVDHDVGLLRKTRL